MILVVGGIASGKRTYVGSLGFGEDQMAAGVLDEKPVLLDLHELLRNGELPESDFERVAGKQVVSCCEVGSGVVPLDRVERDWRDVVGRTCRALAGRADTVVRMVCGIPVVLKGQDACRH